MTTPVHPKFSALDLDALASAGGAVALVVEPDGRLGRPARRIDRLTRGALGRFVASDSFAGMKEGACRSLAYPAGMAAEALLLVKLGRRAGPELSRKAGVAISRAAGTGEVLVLPGNLRRQSDLALGLSLGGYVFDEHRTGGDDEEDTKPPSAITIMVAKPDEAAAEAADVPALAEGVFMTRDLVNEPSNVLTTTEFARRLTELEQLGLEVEVLEEAELEKLGMRALLAVGQGSASPSKVVVMHWRGAKSKSAAPLALVGKGVVFDTGGISLKPAAGMEEMTMDMGGAGVVAGVMKTLAMRKARANVVGLVGLVENMPDGRAQRPGDVVVTMKGDTVEVNNTDAEGRLVLCDVMWYAQDRFKPAGMVDLATLTGAIIVALGHENAGVFSNDDEFASAFLKAAGAEGEGAWRMPLGPAYEPLIKSDIADIKNSAGRPAGSITAAQFLARFVREDVPWIHIDIAGVARIKKAAPLYPKRSTGWGVLALNRLVAERFEV